MSYFPWELCYSVINKEEVLCIYSLKMENTHLFRFILQQAGHKSLAAHQRKYLGYLAVNLANLLTVVAYAHHSRS